MVKRAQAGYLGLITFMDDQVGKVIAALDDTGLSSTARIAYTSDHGDNMGNRGLWGKSVMYEEAVAVPMIIAGPDIPEGRLVKAPCTILDLYPFIIDCAGERDAETLTADHSDASVTDLIAEDAPDRIAFSQYHAMGSQTAAYMVRKGPHKIIYYAAHPTQYFNLDDDPEELNDRGSDPATQQIIEALVAELFTICDPKEIDARAKADQVRMIGEFGGKDAIIERGDLGFSVPPGEKPMFD